MLGTKNGHEKFITDYSQFIHATVKFSYLSKQYSYLFHLSMQNTRLIISTLISKISCPYLADLCRPWKYKPNKIGFTFFSFFYDFLHILQVSALFKHLKQI